MNLPTELMLKLQDYAYSGTLGAFAALVGYLYQVAKHPGNKVTLFMIFATVVIGFYLGVVFGGFIPTDWGNRDAVLLLIGATGLKGFEIVIGWAKAALPNILKMLVQGQQNMPPPPPPPPSDGENGAQ